ncbi:MAG: carbohydrate binding family 9 domain-containing protein [Bacteroidetes bacterium]|nr:carbohydrate binding family 9 domain-containing protein [Bacteroidota bacterium]
MRLTALPWLLAVLLPDSLFAQDAIRISKITDPIVIDGVVDEQAWTQISPIRFIMQKPVFGKAPTEGTELRIGYNEKFLYVSGKLFDSEPEKIQATSFKRDSDKANSEWFGLALDTYNDKENAVAFFTTPTGLRWDATIVEGTGGIVVNNNWNTYWQVATSKNSEGWFAEFQIPLSSLRFSEKNGVVTMGLISWRLLARKNEWSIFPAISDEWGPASFYKVSKAQEIYFEDIKSPRPVYFSPYGLVARSMNSSNETMAGERAKSYESRAEAGLDVKFAPSKNATVDLTVNTDFSQVEVDDRIVTLERYSYFLPEKRQFFQERSRSFDFTFDGSNQVFYSRRIGIDNGRLIRIIGGARSVMRFRKTDVGLLNMQTLGYDSINSRNLGVIRVKQQILNRNSFVGGIATTRMGGKGDSNIVYGVDGLFAIGKDVYIKLAAAQSQGTNALSGIFSKNSSRYYANIERRATTGFGYSLSLFSVGGAYNPGLGFENRTNYYAENMKLSYRWFSKKDNGIYRTSFGLNPLLLYGNDDGRLQSSTIPLTFTVETKSGWSFSTTSSLRKEYVADSLMFLNDLRVGAGSYPFHEAALNISTPSIKPFYLAAEVRGGTFYDGKRTSLTVQPIWNVSRHIEFEAGYQLDHIVVGSEEVGKYSHLIRVKTLLMLDTKFSLAVYAQFTTLDKNLLSNFRFRYNPKEGRDLYITFNQALDTDSNLTPSPQSHITDWTANLKYVHTLIVR